MKNLVVLLALCWLFALPVAADTGDDVLASRGKGSVTYDEFDAQMAHIPEADRAPFLRDGKRLESMLANMLVLSQLAAEARAAGFDKDPQVQTQMRLAAQQELAKNWLDHYVDSQPKPDLEALAHEYYEAHPDEFMTEPTVSVSHILISNKKRSNEEAKALAEKVLKEVRADPSQFDKLILKYSEDESLASNKGTFDGVGRKEMVKPFADAAFAMKPGEISDPVYSVYGYHIIRLNKIYPAKLKPFEAVHDQLVKQALAKHQQRIREDYLGQLTSKNVDMTMAKVRKMLERYFDADSLAEWDKTQEQNSSQSQ